MIEFTVVQARRYANKTQQESAEHIGVSAPTYKKYEENPALFPLGKAYKLAEFFGVPYDSIKFF